LTNWESLLIDVQQIVANPCQSFFIRPKEHSSFFAELISQGQKYYSKIEKIGHTLLLQKTRSSHCSP